MIGPSCIPMNLNPSCSNTNAAAESRSGKRSNHSSRKRKNFWIGHGWGTRPANSSDIKRVFQCTGMQFKGGKKVSDRMFMFGYSGRDVTRRKFDMDVI